MAKASYVEDFGMNDAGGGRNKPEKTCPSMTYATKYLRLVIYKQIVLKGYFSAMYQVHLFTSDELNHYVITYTHTEI
jgi:hypothetical protein